MKKLIQPVQAGQVLLDDIRQTTVPHGSVAIWWLGQSGFAIKSAAMTFYIDLYLSEHLTTKYADTDKPHIRMTEAPLRGTDLHDVTLLFSSHKHSDHLDPIAIPQIMATNPEACLVLPAPVRAYAIETLGIAGNRVIPTVGDEQITVDGMDVTVVPSAHPDFDYEDGVGYPFIGYVFDVGGVRVYHSGDTLVYDGLAERLKPLEIDIALLPINGTSERLQALNVPPNMNIDEALGLAHAIGDPLIIPQHYDMFTFNTADVSDFEAKASTTGQAYHVMQCGEKFIWSK